MALPPRARALFLAVPLLSGTGPAAAQEVGAPAERFWQALTGLCGQAFAGRVTEAIPADTVFSRSPLRMHVRHCTADSIRIPFHVGDDRSRTWVVTRTAGGVRLKHDHRHEDGSEDAVTQYGGDHRAPGTATTQEFPADAFTAELIPYARTNVWTIELVPGTRFAYALRREGTERRFRVDFDLTTPITPPPPPWGAAP